MSKIEEIRKRHQERQAGEEPADYSLAFEEAHEDRATLLAALDGEWQSDIPSEGQWHLTVPHDIRSKWGAGFDWPLEVAISVGGLIVIHDLHYNARGYTADLFTGALWQRRTVPADPFADREPVRDIGHEEALDITRRMLDRAKKPAPCQGGGE